VAIGVKYAKKKSNFKYLAGFGIFLKDILAQKPKIFEKGVRVFHEFCRPYSVKRTGLFLIVEEAGIGV
jgi:hypothetical protein